MRIPIIFHTILLFFGIETASQTTDYSDIKRHGVYAELYLIRHDFSQGFASINYELNIGKKRRTNLRVGIYPDFESAISLPLTISWMNRPHSDHHFEYGIGAVFRIEHFVDPYNPSREWYFYLPAIMIPLMYRYQKSSGLFFRAGCNVFVSWPTIISPSLSVGYKF